jgi:hypothetical protein
VDRLAVITALENCIGNGPCKDCPFTSRIPGYTRFPDCMVELQKEALKLIRELTEPTIVQEALLDGASYKEEIFDTVYVCNNCGSRLIGHDRFCEHCGKPIGAVLSTEKTEVDVILI